MNDLILKLKILWFKNNAQNHIDVYNMMREMLKNGINLTDCVRKIIAGKRMFGGDWSPLYAVMDQCYKNIGSGRHGTMFSLSMRDFISEDEFMILFASEENGILEEGLADVIIVMESKKAISSTIKSSLAMPAVMIGIACFILSIMSSDIMPLMSKMIPVEQWKIAGTILYHASNIMMNYGFIILDVFFAMFSFFSYTAPRLTHPVIRPIMDYLPLYSQYKRIQASSFLVSISAMLAGGTSFSDSLRTLQRYSSPYLKTYIDKSIAIQSRGGDGGGSNGDCLNMGLFDDDASFSIFIYADLADFNEAIHKIAKRVTDNLVKSISITMAIVSNILSAVVMLIIPLMMTMISDFNNAILTLLY